MTPSTALAAASAVAVSAPASPPDVGRCIVTAAHLLLPHLEHGRQVDAAVLRAAMEQAFGSSDASGAWDWKTAYDACEAATVLFIRKYGKVLLRKAGSPANALPLLEKIVGLLPTHTRRSLESEAYQQFSTPISLGLAVTTAAAIKPTDRLLEPSAGTGLLAILAEIAGSSLLLNELADSRASVLSLLFPNVTVTRHDAAQIHDHLDSAIVPSVVIMNPPFSAMANVEGRIADAALRHIASALARLADGGRLVAITGANVAPDAPSWRDAYVRLQERGRVVFSAAVDGRAYAKHGTTFPTRLTVIDKLPADDPTVFPAAPGVAPDVATLLAWIAERVPTRLPVDPSLAAAASATTPRTVRGYIARAARSGSRPASVVDPGGVDLAYETVDWTPPQGTRLSDAIYEDYGLQSIRIPGAQDHPTQLVQSAAMATTGGILPRLRASPRSSAWARNWLSTTMIACSAPSAMAARIRSTMPVRKSSADS
jgi:predicted RNA methylase